MPEERGYLPEEQSYMLEERSYMPEEPGYMEEKKTMNSVDTTFAMQPVCKAAQAAHALRSDQQYVWHCSFTAHG
jgi:hypothetical protein